MLTLVFHAISIEISRFFFWLIIRSQGLALLFHSEAHHHQRERDMGMTVRMVFLLCSINVFIEAVGLGKSSFGAAAVRGNVTIPYPFGIEPGCYIDDSFAIDCNNTLGSPKPFLRRLDLEVLDIHTSRQLSYVIMVSYEWD